MSSSLSTSTDLVRHIPVVRRTVVVGLLAIGLLLRLLLTFALDPSTPYEQESADSAWYLANGAALVTGAAPRGIPVDVSSLAVAPVYPLLLGVAQAVLPSAGAVLAIRVLQAVLGTATAYLAYRLAYTLTDSPRAALIALAAVALGPAFILEAVQITTEITYIFFVAAGLTTFVECLARRDRTSGWIKPLGLAALFLGLATLTRAVLLLFPVGLAIVLFLTFPPRAAVQRAGWLLLVYAVVVSTWTVYNLARWNRFVVGGDGFAAFLYVGATGWQGPAEVDARLAEQTEGNLPDEATAPERQEAYVNAATSAIERDPGGYIRHRLSELAGAYLQPHGTVFFPGESLREMGASWLRDDRSMGGLIALTRGDAFWPKFLIYVWHYMALAAGLVGMWFCRSRWPLALPLVGFIAYTSLVHLVLLALPRYIFPTEVFWWVFAAAALARVRLCPRVPMLALDTRPPGTE